MSALDLSRRSFMKASVIAGISVYVAPPGSEAWAALFEEKFLTPIRWNSTQGKAKFRIDGVGKVTGQKVFARDIRARDMPHWPPQQSHAFILRVTRADSIFEGIDLSLLGADLKPDRIVTAEDLLRDNLAFPAFYGDDMLLPAGKTPAYLGHAVAILIYHDFARFCYAKDALKFHDEVIRYGRHTGPLERDPWGSFRFVRVGGANAYEDDVFSSLKDSPVFPGSVRKHMPVWPAGHDHGKLDEQGMFYADAIRKEQDQPPPDWLVMDRTYTTQSIDTAALEADNANGWYDSASQTLHLVVPTQSPHEVAGNAAAMVTKCHIPVRTIVLHSCYTVGYGSKDHYNFPFYGLVTALYADSKPVRLANDRYEQFQTGLKRHAFTMHYRMAVDRKTGLLQSFVADMIANGGGRANFSASIAMVGPTAAQALYYFPKSDLSSVAIASHAIDAGSARGYGTLQTMASTEAMIDEIAGALGLDPIEFRLKNALRSGMKNTQGAIPGGVIRADEVLRRAAEHPLWLNRHKRKVQYEASNPGHHYGVGFACVQKNFGSASDASFAKVEISPEGHVLLHHTGTEMGTGMSTSQAIACAKWLGKPADEIRLAVLEWPDLPLTTSGDPFLMSQAEQDRLQANPRWSPSIASASTASNSAYFFTQSTREASRLVFTEGLWPAAMAIWSHGLGGGQAGPFSVRMEDARWVEGSLTAGGLQALPLKQLAAKAHELGLATGAVVHTFNRWQWSEAEFELRTGLVRLPVDGVSLRYGHPAPQASLTPGGYKVLDRKRAFMPPVQRKNAGVTYYSCVATLVELAVHSATGKVELLTHHSIMECGNMLSPQLVSSQLQGGLAMGIGHALHEYLPLYEDGPGNGTWNFNRYELPRAHDVAVWTQTSEVLPPLSDTDPSKGIAEVVMIPVVAAIVNGVAHAINHRFTDLPITPEKIQEILA